MNAQYNASFVLTGRMFLSLFRMSACLPTLQHTCILLAWISNLSFWSIIAPNSVMDSKVSIFVLPQLRFSSPLLGPSTVAWHFKPCVGVH